MKVTLDVNVLKDTNRKAWSVMKKGILGIVTAVMVLGFSTITSFAATGTVTAQTAKIREKASTDSTVVASTAKGSKIDIVGAEKDASGAVWYKVPIAGGSYGYVRSDLVETTDEIKVSTAQSEKPASTATQEKLPATVPISIGEQQATVKCDTNVKIRSGASTSHDVITSLPNGTAITLIGEANDAAGNKWYQLRCTHNNKEIEGYIRSDLITIGIAVEEEGAEPADGETIPEEGEPSESMDENQQNTDQGEQAEEPEEPVEEHNDYEIVYLEDMNNPGQFHYYLYDNLNGTRQDVETLLQAVTISNENVAVLQEQVSHGKIIIIVLAVVVVLLFAALTLLFIRLRSSNGYDDYDYGEEEEQFEEPEPRRSHVRRCVEPEESEEPIRREPIRREPVRREAPRRELPPQKEPTEERAVRTPRRTQNFLTDEDEFEFEFLNMDDKDL